MMSDQCLGRSRFKNNCQGGVGGGGISYQGESKDGENARARGGSQEPREPPEKEGQGCVHQE